nr:CBO0543 family protein [Pelosinus sp. UFO1]
MDWKRYGLLYLLTGLIGNMICYLFVEVGFYSFPYIFLPITKIPLIAILAAFSYYVILGVRYSPVNWAYKIAFYGVIVNTGMFLETVLKNMTNLIRYDFEWDFWGSYTTWWIFFILMEWIGGKIIPPHLRKPLNTDAFRFGHWFWFVIHIVAIFTIFLAGLYLGLQIKYQK